MQVLQIQNFQTTVAEIHVSAFLSVVLFMGIVKLPRISMSVCTFHGTFACINSEWPECSESTDFSKF